MRSHGAIFPFLSSASYAVVKKNNYLVTFRLPYCELFHDHTSLIAIIAVIIALSGDNDR